MTSKLSKANSFNIQIPANEITKDVLNTAPVVDSVALCGQVIMVDKRKLSERFGKLSTNAVLAVQLGLSYVFDIR